jgi:hypothetical protein
MSKHILTVLGHHRRESTISGDRLTPLGTISRKRESVMTAAEHY